MNALQSGIHAESTIITGDDPDALAQLTETFYHDHQPETAIERALLDNVVRDTWLLTRFFRIDYEIEDISHPKEFNQAGKAFIDSSPDQSRLQRRINDTRRSQIQAFKEFQRLQADRSAQPAQQPQPRLQPLDVTAVPSIPQDQIGFVPQTPPQVPDSAPLSVPPTSKARPAIPAHSPIGFVA